MCVRHRDCPDSIELLRPVSGSLPGDRVFIAGLTESRTETPDVLNPKKKIWDKLQVGNCSFIWYSVCLSVSVSDRHVPIQLSWYSVCVVSLR